MNVQNAETNYKQALERHRQALDALKALQRGADGITVNKARKAEREAWHNVGGACRGLLDAILENIGW